MYLNEEMLQKLKEEKNQAEADAKKTFEEKIFPEEKEKLKKFFADNLTQVLVDNLHAECEKAGKKGFFVNPVVKISVSTSTVSTNTVSSMKEFVVKICLSNDSFTCPRHKISSPEAFDIYSAERLISEACAELSLRYTSGCDVSEIKTGVIEIDLR